MKEVMLLSRLEERYSSGIISQPGENIRERGQVDEMVD
jgi:hypothetical protein